MDILEFADGRLELLYRREVLKHSRYQLHEHLHQGHTADDKSINTRIDQAVKVQHQRLATLAAQNKHQEAQCELGILHNPTLTAMRHRDQAQPATGYAHRRLCLQLLPFTT